LAPPHALLSFTQSGSHPTQLFKNNPKNGDCLQKTGFFWGLFEKTILERPLKKPTTSHTTA
jgi:hypothetical protein